MTNDEITALKAQLDGLSGQARTHPLLRLGQLYADRYWRAGPGSAASVPYLDEGIRALEEAYGYLAPGDALRATSAVWLGILHGTKHTGHFGPEQHRETGIVLLEESVGFAGIQPVLADMGRVVLGQLYVSRVVGKLQSNEFVMAAMRGSASFTGTADLDRAADIYHEVLAKSTMPEMTNTARAMLTMVDAIRAMLGGFSPGVGGFDLSRMMEAVTKLQEVKQTGLRTFVAGVGPSPVPDLFTSDWLASLDPLDRPVAVASGPEPAAKRADAATAATQTRPSQTLDVAGLRRELQERLARDGDVYTAAVSLLRSEDAPEWIDTFVSLATSVVHGGGEATGTDHFLLATALQLRSRRDEGGWVAQDDDPVGWEVDGDVQAAAANLRAAARKLPLEQPEGIAALLFLAMLLPDEVFAELDEKLAPVTAAVRALGAEALIFPEPADSLRLNAQTGRLEAAFDIGAAVSTNPTSMNTVVVAGTDQAPKDDTAVWYISSMTQVMRPTGRGRRPATEEPVFVTNPRKDREAATVEAMLLRRTFYPRSTGLGTLIENADGAGTPDEVRAHLDASLLHLDCGITATGALELAGAAQLDLHDVSTSRGGLVILPPGQFLPVADLLLAAGFSGVVGWRRPVPGPVAALILFLLHAELADLGRPPAAAIGEVRRWFANPDRKIPSHLPAGYAERLDTVHEGDWMSLVYLGG